MKHATSKQKLDFKGYTFFNWDTLFKRRGLGPNKLQQNYITLPYMNVGTGVLATKSSQKIPAVNPSKISKLLSTCN